MTSPASSPSTEPTLSSPPTPTPTPPSPPLPSPAFWLGIRNGLLITFAALILGLLWYWLSALIITTQMSVYD